MEITIKGRAGSGKSAVAQHIAETLTALGFKVTHVSDCVRSPEDQAAVLSHVVRAGATPITLVEEQTTRK